MQLQQATPLRISSFTVHNTVLCSLQPPFSWPPMARWNPASTNILLPNTIRQHPSWSWTGIKISSMAINFKAPSGKLLYWIICGLKWAVYANTKWVKLFPGGRWICHPLTNISSLICLKCIILTCNQRALNVNICPIKILNFSYI